MCVHLYLQFYYSLGNISYYGIYSFTCFKAVFIGSIIWFIFDNVSYLHTFVLLCSMFRSRILRRSGTGYSLVGSFFFALEKQRYLYFRSEICCQDRFRRHQFPIISTTRSSAVAEGLRDVHVSVKFSYVVTEYV